MPITPRHLLIRNLVGDITPEQLRHIDSVASARVGVFLPVTGPCGYAITPEHTHPAYLLTLTFDDRSELLVDGRRLRGRAGMLWAFSPDVPHQEVAVDGAPRYAAITVEKRFFETLAKAHPRVSGRVLRGEGVQASPALLGCVRRLVREHELKLPGYHEVVAAREVELVHVALRSLALEDTREARGPSVRAQTDHLRLSAAIHFAHAHFRDRIAVDDLARAVCMSHAHFAREFKRELGVPPMDYVLGLRLEAARRRLLAGDEPLTAIALECGFGSSSYFSYCFGRHFGVAPSEYRKRHAM